MYQVTREDIEKAIPCCQEYRMGGGCEATGRMCPLFDSEEGEVYLHPCDVVDIALDAQEKLLQEIYDFYFEKGSMFEWTQSVKSHIVQFAEKHGLKLRERK